MDIGTIYFWGKTKYWWTLIVAGLLMITCGFWLWSQPALGYEVLSLLLGWIVILFGVVQLVVSSSVKQRVRGWGWWLAGGIIDILIGFILVGNLSFGEAVLPFFFAVIFLYKGVSNLFSAFSMISTDKYWWLYLINGLLLSTLGILFFSMPFMATFSIVFLCAVAFVYWGVSLLLFGCSLRPRGNRT